MVRRRSFIKSSILFKNKFIGINASVFFKLFLYNFSCLTNMNRHKLALRKKFMRFFFIFYVFKYLLNSFNILKISTKLLNTRTKMFNIIYFYDFYINKISWIDYLIFYTFYFIYFGLTVNAYFKVKSFTSLNCFYLLSYFFNSTLNIENFKWKSNFFITNKIIFIFNTQFLFF